MRARGHMEFAMVEAMVLVQVKVGASSAVAKAVGQMGGVTEAYVVTGPYDINTFAVVAGKAALADPEHMRQYVAQVLAAKTWTIGELRRLGVRYHADGGNYVLVWPPGDAEGVVRALRGQGILVRSMAGKPVIDGSFRLTIGTLEQMRRFVAAFSTVALRHSGSAR